MDAKQVVYFGTETFKSLIDGLALLNVNSSKPKVLKNSVSKETIKKEVTENEENLKSNYTSCSTCRSYFSDPDKFRQHFKEDWHRYNLKLNLKEKDPISEKEFEELEDDVSSISGSESECSDDDEIDNKHEQFTKEARVLFQNSKNQVLSIYRCLIASKKSEVLEDESVQQAKTFVETPSCLIMMLGGGHFAAGLFKDDEPILHKTFHSYTVRQKQGSSQSSNDNKGSFAKSAGASLRRYNETILAQHIQEITISWAKEIEACDFIFYRAVGPGNKKAFFGGKNPPLDKTDSRLRTIPFNTKRATFNEVKRVYACLKSVLVYDLEQVLLAVSKHPSYPEQEEKEKAEENRSFTLDADPIPETPAQEEEEESAIWMFGNRCVLTEEPAEEVSVSDEIEVKKNFFDEINNSSSEEDRHPEDEEVDEAQGHSDREAMTSQVSKKKRKKKKGRQKMFDESTPPDVYLNCIFLSALEQEDHVVLENAIAENEDNKHLRKGLNNYIDKDKNTLLHFAAKKGYFHHVWVLLEAGASPCYKNKSSHTAYDVSLNKDTRDAFRRFCAAFPDKYDYSNSHIPKPLTDELVKAQNEKKREKNRKLKEKAKEKKLKEKEEEDRQRFLQLSDREKRALAAERRILAQQEELKTAGALPIITSRCYACGCDITGKIPFEYDYYKFCSMPCAKVHRNKKLEGS